MSIYLKRRALVELCIQRMQITIALARIKYGEFTMIFSSPLRKVPFQLGMKCVPLTTHAYS
jgi:hypothetical protein